MSFIIQQCRFTGLLKLDLELVILKFSVQMSSRGCHRHKISVCGGVISKNKYTNNPGLVSYILDSSSS